jgi:serine phosphatase RsbU (regulator of sigma subunit)
MGNFYIPPTIDEYLCKRLMPVEGAIPQLPGIEMYGISIPAGAVGGDLFEYINFQQRYDIDSRNGCSTRDGSGSQLRNYHN